jgi:hypothetical protein
VISVVAVPKAVLRTRALSRHWSPPVVGPGPNSSYANQCVAAPAGVSGLELAAGVSVVVSAEIRLSVDRARAISSRISTRSCAGNGSEDRVQLRPDLVDLSPLDPYPPGRQSYQPKTVGPAFVSVIRIRQRRCLIMAVR